MNTVQRNSAVSAGTRTRLQNLHRALLRLHKVLLDDERATYEQPHDRTNAGKMLQLVISDPQFTWLRRISEIIVQIDELLESDDAGAETAANDLVKNAQTLLTPGEDEFGRKYQAALQRLPDAVL